MTRLEKYRKQHAETVAAQKAILEAAEAASEHGTLTAEQEKDYQALDKTRLSLQGSIKREGEIEEAERAAAVVATIAPGAGGGVRITGGQAREAGRPSASSSSRSCRPGWASRPTRDCSRVPRAPAPTPAATAAS